MPLAALPRTVGTWYNITSRRALGSSLTYRALRDPCGSKSAGASGQAATAEGLSRVCKNPGRRKKRSKGKGQGTGRRRACWVLGLIWPGACPSMNSPKVLWIGFPCTGSDQLLASHSKQTLKYPSYLVVAVVRLVATIYGKKHKILYLTRYLVWFSDGPDRVVRKIIRVGK